MRLPESVRRTLFRWVIDYCDRGPDFVIGREDDPYLLRWYWIPKNRFFNVYLHHFKRSDDDRACHTHPWLSASILLYGSYTEHSPHDALDRLQGHLGFRLPSSAHRIELWRDRYGSEKPVWTIFLTGPKVQEWGFLCPKGFRHWKDFVEPTSSGQVGRGCD